MKDTLANKLASFDGTLAVADKPEFKLIWENQPPLAFGEDLTVVRTAVTALRSSGAQQSAAISGATDALRNLRHDFETALHPLARATYQCLLKLGRNEDAAKVNLTPSDLRNARGVALAGQGETVLNLAEPLAQMLLPAIERFGITMVKVSVVDDLWERYSTAVGAPASARSRRKAQTNQLPGQFAAVEAQFSTLDDLVVQFNDTPVGKQFVAAWFNARHVADLGKRAAKPNPTPAPVPQP